VHLPKIAGVASVHLQAVPVRLRFEEIMRRAVYKVKSFAIVGPYTLSIGFDDDTLREIDFSPILQGELYGPLRELRLFNQVRLDGEVQTLVWPNGADFDPATLHDWPSQSGEVSSALEDWWQQKEIASKATQS
jgi:hypothetical protein